MKADLILKGGRVLTLGRAGLRPRSHLAIAGGRVLAVGGAEVLALAARGTRVVPLAGATVLPGFNDPHAHVVYHALAGWGADLTGSRSIAELQRRLRRVAERMAPGEWCLGRGYSELELAEGRPPTREELDAAVGGRPAFVDHRGGHSRVANSAALAAAGLSAITPDPPGGSLGRAGGALTGLLSESAMRLVADHQPPPPLARRKEGVLRTLGILSSVGITSVGAAVNRGFADDHRVFSELAESGRLKVRVNEFLSWELLPALTALGFASGSAGDRLRFGPVKVFVDGGAASGTAAFREREPIWRTTPEELGELVMKAHRGGLQVAAHCVGDAAIEAMADAVEAAQQAMPRPAARHRIEHCTHCPADLRKRLATLGMVAVMQPLYTTFGRFRLAGEVGGIDQRDICPHADLLRAGVPVAFSSDLPVTPDPSPWPGLAAAITDSIQGLTRLQALRAYTVTGAFSSHQELRLGTLEAGKEADFQIYSEDPLALTVEQWPALRPRLVAVAGVPVAGDLV